MPICSESPLPPPAPGKDRFAFCREICLSKTFHIHGMHIIFRLPFTPQRPEARLCAVHVQHVSLPLFITVDAVYPFLTQWIFLVLGYNE